MTRVESRWCSRAEGPATNSHLDPCQCPPCPAVSSASYLVWSIPCLSLFFERGAGRRETSIVCLPTGDQAHNPGMCPDRELNRQAFSPREPHQSGRFCVFLVTTSYITALSGEVPLSTALCLFLMFFCFLINYPL